MELDDDRQPIIQSIYEDDDDDETIREGAHDDEEINKKTAVEIMTRRTKYFACLILLLGLCATTGFLHVAIKAIHDDHEHPFKHDAAYLVQRIESAWNDYENACLWIHEACRSRKFSRSDFRVLYDYLTSRGLDFQAAEFVPNLTREERDAYEFDSRAFYQRKYPTIVNYSGFTGLEPSHENPHNLLLQSRSEQPFYFPVHYVEPVETNAAAIDFDLWSSESRRASIQEALDTWKPCVTERLQIVQETEKDAYSVLLMHPGTPIKSQPKVKPKDLAVMVIRIRSLLERSVDGINWNMKAYIYDSTTTKATATAVFLAAASLAANEVEFLPEIEFNVLKSENSGRREYLLEKTIQVASRNWTIVAVNSEDTDKYNMVVVVMGGIVIFLSSALLSTWMYRHIRRTSEMCKIAAAAEAGNIRIVHELFPSNVRERLISTAGATPNRKQARNEVPRKSETARKSSDDLIQPLVESGRVFSSAPIADLFPNVTIMFGDLVGFTAWSSVREPAQVFMLLETIYHAFDEIANRRRIFKVETVGDCYVAAAGVPEARKDHAVAMARFAVECLREVRTLTKDLETLLGPETGDLQMRIGLHSGEVTAGVLRGLKGRFQLFGDSMNTASRMESTGLPNSTQVSQETAALLRSAGKTHWLTPRQDKVVAKGKGELQTFWLDIKNDSLDMTNFSGVESHVVQEAAPKAENVSQTAEYEAKIARLVGWNVEAMSRMLRDIAAKRTSMRKKSVDVQVNSICPEGGQKTILECATEYVVLLPPVATPSLRSVDASSIKLDPQVVDEVESLVSSIASLYRKVPFHNFEHASHVAMSVTKLLGRVVKNTEPTSPTASGQQAAANRHDYTTVVASDPMTHFACFFAALIHDMDHQGVPNATLVNEGSVLAKIYKGRSVHEQNSVTIAWELLRESRFRNLRKCIYSDQEEMLRFRQLLVNLVMATDVLDKDLGAVRQERWERAFNSDTHAAGRRRSEGGTDDGNVYKLVHGKATRRMSEGGTDVAHLNMNYLANSKAMIVLEHVIQASDVSHTMQHWHVYRKWNERLFQETYKAYEDGRTENDPSENWYDSEIGFFDFYVIPFAKKLAKCEVFGVCSDELMNYAIRNRQEWHQKGKEMVESYLESYFNK